MSTSEVFDWLSAHKVPLILVASLLVVAWILGTQIDRRILGNSGAPAACARCGKRNATKYIPCTAPVFWNGLTFRVGHRFDLEERLCPHCYDACAAPVRVRHTAARHNLAEFIARKRSEIVAADQAEIQGLLSPNTSPPPPAVSSAQLPTDVL